MHGLRHGPQRAREALLVAAVALSSCGGGSAGDARGLSEAGYLGVVKRGCLAARQVAERAVLTSAAPAAYLRRAAEAAESIQREFANVRPPARSWGSPAAAASREVSCLRGCGPRACSVGILVGAEIDVLEAASPGRPITIWRSD